MGRAKILIVDDQPSIIKMARVKLDKEFEVYEANNGEEALKMVESAKPNLIILDVMMPKMDGFEVNRRLKQNEQFKKIPVIMLTARGSFEDQTDALEAGIEEYVTKPFNPQKLVDTVKEVLEKKASHWYPEDREKRHKAAKLHTMLDIMKQRQRDE